MASPIATAERLQAELEVVLASVTMAQRPRSIVEQALDDVTDIADELRRINDEVVPLQVDEPVLEDAARQWEHTEPDTYRKGSNVIERQITMSTTLNALYRTGADVTSIRKYSEHEMAFARLLGDNFAELNTGWDRMKFAVQDGTGVFTFTREQADSVVELLKKLRDGEHIGEFQLEYFKYKTKSYEPANLKGLFGNKNPKARYRATVPVDSIREADLYTGLWFNAYAASIVRDHLTRNELDHEVYANVAYRAPADIELISGDFDVLASAGGRTVLLECKSGRLSAERTDFSEIVDKAQGLGNVLRQAGGEFDLVPLLLFNHHLADEENVRNELAGSIVRPIRLDELRKTIVEIFNGR